MAGCLRSLRLHRRELKNLADSIPTVDVETGNVTLLEYYVEQIQSKRNNFSNLHKILIGSSVDDKAEQKTIHGQKEADAELIIKVDDIIVRIRMDIKRMKEIKNANVSGSERQDNSQQTAVSTKSNS
jgi:citrate synthase